MTQRSPLNTGRTIARNRRKQARSAENVQFRADLHRQKAATSSASSAATIQGQIDQISLRK